MDWSDYQHPCSSPAQVLHMRIPFRLEVLTGISHSNMGFDDDDNSLQSCTSNHGMLLHHAIRSELGQEYQGEMLHEGWRRKPLLRPGLSVQTQWSVRLTDRITGSFQLRQWCSLCCCASHISFYYADISTYTVGPSTSFLSGISVSPCLQPYDLNSLADPIHQCNILLRRENRRAICFDEDSRPHVGWNQPLHLVSNRAFSWDTHCLFTTFAQAVRRLGSDDSTLEFPQGQVHAYWPGNTVVC